jgi:hypothetical protein
MNSVLMDMSSPGSENESTMVEEYSDEVMFAGWNPQVAVAVELSLALIEKQVALLAGLTNEDVDAFLQKMYEYQR